ncbi:MAG: hypothetical protein IPL40_14155 [Proteobacteria bacterium]|nr:hypothetical protein [Pseudomonadota bacterium]
MPSWLLLAAAVPAAARATTTAQAAQPGQRSVLASGLPEGAGLALKLKANRLVLHRDRGCASGEACASELELVGAVRVRSASLELRAGRVTVDLDARGRPYRLRAGEGVTVRLGDREGSADALSLLLKPPRITLRGNARLASRKQGLALRGSWIEVDLENGAVVVQRAEVALP